MRGPDGMSEKPRILYVIQEYPVTTQTFVENEILALEELGYRVTRFPLRLTAAISLADRDVVTLKTLLRSPRLWLAALRVILILIKRFSLVVRLFRAEKFELKDFSRQLYALLHAILLRTYLLSETTSVSHVHAHFLGRCLDVAIYAKILGCGDEKVSATGHAGDVTNPQRVRRLRIQVADLDSVVCASKAVESALKSATGRSATAIIHCGVTGQGPRTAGDASGRALRVLSVGRLVEKKGFSDAVVAAQSLALGGKDFTWRIVGNGPLAGALSQQSAGLVDQGRLEWLGAQPSSAVLAMLNDWADIFVLPCRPAADGDVDGIPVALMEAMAVGIPVIAGKVAGIPELIRHGDTGYLVAPGNPDELEHAIRHLMDDEVARRVVGAAGKAYVEQEFNLVIEAGKLATAVFGN